MYKLGPNLHRVSARVKVLRRVSIKGDYKGFFLAFYRSLYEATRSSIWVLKGLPFGVSVRVSETEGVRFPGRHVCYSRDASLSFGGSWLRIKRIWHRP